ncbi:MAG: AmmeMemoRadiSam system protein A [Spirochaetia bacterium]|nr:AmmeMemoRadiSam system protein A [Spirochaetia bacterium]
MKLTQELRNGLIQIALYSIEYGLKQHEKYIPDIESLPSEYKLHAATFVTVFNRGKLNGCIGTITAFRPLALDVSLNAWDAAFGDRRFKAIDSMQDLEVEISILSRLKKISFKDEEDLTAKVNANTDGILLKYADKQATFLPTVWESLPDKKAFIDHLKVKAGLSSNFCSEKIQIFRYTTEKIKSNE